MNSGDAAKLQAYIDAYHRKSKPQGWLDLRKVTGDLSVLKIEKNEPNDIVAVVGESMAGRRLAGGIQDRSHGPDEVPGWQPGRRADRPDDLAIPRLTQTEALKALNARAEGLAAKDEFMGAVLVENHGKILVEKTWGYADRGAQVPLKAADKFRLGSMNKMFTATATLQLVGKGKLSLDGTVAGIFPTIPQGHRRPYHHPHAAHPYRRNRRHLRRRFRQASPGAEDPRRLRKALRRARAGVPAGIAVGLLQFRGSSCLESSFRK